MASHTEPPKTQGLHADLGPLIRKTDIAMVCFSGIFLCGRLIARNISKARFWLDDYFIIAGLVLAWGTSFAMLEMVSAGLGTHLEVIEAKDPGALTQFLLRVFAFEILYSTCLPVIKCSILLFYYRIFPTRQFRIVVYVVGAFVLCWFLSNILVTSIFRCTSVKPGAEQTAEGAKCIHAQVFYVSNAVLNTLGDVALLCMPLPMVWTLQLAQARKTALTVVFLLGSCASASSVVRFVYLMKGLKAGPDMTWNYAKVGLWTSVEANLGVIAACMMAMRPLLRSVPKYFGMSDTRKSKTSAQLKPAPAGFHWVTDVQRQQKNAYSQHTFVDTELGARISANTDRSCNTQDYGEDVSLVPLHAIHVKSDVDVSDNYLS